MSDPVATYVLATIRAAQVKSRPETVRILRYAVDKANVEGPVESWVADPTTILGSLATGGLSDSEQVVAGKIQDATVWIITLPWDAAVTTKDHVRVETVDGAPISPFRTFDVRHASAETGQWNQRVLATEIPNAD